MWYTTMRKPLRGLHSAYHIFELISSWTEKNIWDQSFIQSRINKVNTTRVLLQLDISQLSYNHEHLRFFIIFIYSYYHLSKQHQSYKRWLFVFVNISWTVYDQSSLFIIRVLKCTYQIIFIHTLNACLRLKWFQKITFIFIFPLDRRKKHTFFIRY